MKKLFFRYFCLFMSIGIMVFIFMMSAQNSETSSTTSGRLISVFADIFVKGFKNGSFAFRQSIINAAQFFVRKFAHFFAYFSLGFFVCGFNTTVFAKQFKICSISVCFALFYAITDEFHQYFIPGRSAEIRDVLIDFSGALVGALLMVLIVFLFRRFKYENPRKLKQ